MKVRMVWEFDVDDSWGETTEECIEIAKKEFESLGVDEFNFEVVDNNKYPYETIETKGEIKI